MKAGYGMLVALLLFASMPVRAQFEGAIDMKMTRANEGAAHEVRYSMFVKRDMLAARAREADEGTKIGKFIFRGDKKLMWVVDDDKKSYLEMSLPEDANHAGKKKDKEEATKAKVNLRKTGKTGTILSYACDEWTAEDEGEVTHIWGTSRLGNVYESLMKSFEKMSFRRDQMEGWEQELAKMKIFPLKIISTKDGDTIETQEVTRIDARPLEMSMFEPPSGYKKQSLDVDVGKIMEQLKEKMKSGGGAGDSSLNSEEIRKLMKGMQEKFKESEKDSADTSDDHE